MLVKRDEVLKEDGSIGYVESVFKSENILNTVYYPDSQVLYIGFSRGRLYSYANISPELYQEFEDAESSGKFFHKRINKKAAHPFRSEYTLKPYEIEELNEIVKKHKPDDDEDD